MLRSKKSEQYKEQVLYLLHYLSTTLPTQCSDHRQSRKVRLKVYTIYKTFWQAMKEEKGKTEL